MSLPPSKLVRKIINKLPDSDEKESLYNPLGRLGHASLKKK